MQAHTHIQSSPRLVWVKWFFFRGKNNNGPAVSWLCPAPVRKYNTFSLQPSEPHWRPNMAPGAKWVYHPWHGVGASRPCYYMITTWSRGCYMDTSNPKIDFDSASQSSPLSTFAQCTLHTGNMIHTINNWSGIVLLKSSNQLRPQLNSMLSLLDHGWVSCVGMLINDSDVAVVK